MPPLTIHFINDCDNWRRGTYFHYHNLAVALTKLGHNVRVFSTDTTLGVKDREEIRDGVSHRLINTPFKITFLRQLLDDYPHCDIAHLFQPQFGPALTWLIVLSKKSKVLLYDWDDLLVTAPFKNFQTNQNPMTTLMGQVKQFATYHLQDFLPAKATHVTTCSHYLADLASRRKARKVTVVYNGTWSLPPLDKYKAREKLGLCRDGFYVGFMGNAYGLLDWCFRALKENLHRDENLRIALCGPCTSESLCGQNSEIKQRVDELGVLSPSDARDFAAAIDIGLLPLDDSPFHQSRFPMKFAEYLGAGTPVLCSNIGECIQLTKELPFVINAGKTRDEFIDAFSQVVTLKKDNLLPKVHLQKVQQVFSWESIAEGLLKAYYEELSNLS
jgi:glycosyltransferase involved in cell wall biosynthesis